MDVGDAHASAEEVAVADAAKSVNVVDPIPVAYAYPENYKPKKMYYEITQRTSRRKTYESYYQTPKHMQG